MSNIKKIIAVVLALVMALSVATIAFAAEGDAYSITVTSDKATIAAGETATVTVKVTTNFYVSAMSIPVFFDNTKVTASAGEVLLSGVGDKANIATETSSDVDKLFEGSGHTKDDYGVRALIYIGKKDDVIKMYNNEAVMSFTVTAKDGATGAVVLECISTAVKTSSNPSGTLYISKNGSGNATLDSLPEVVDSATVTGATTTINIASAAQPADLELKSTATAGIVIDTNKTFGGQYDGVVYGFTLDDSTAVIKATTMYTANLQASNGGSLQFTAIKVGRTNCYGTGATIKVLNQDGTLSKTYVIVIFGDVNSDGAITSTDTGILYAHQQEVSLITSDALIMAANTVTEGRTAAAKQASMYTISATDTGIIYAHVKGDSHIDQQAAAALQNSYNVNYQ